MPCCAVRHCKNNNTKHRKKDGVTFHVFPADMIMREKWRKIIAKERCDKFYKPNKKDIVCSSHFLKTDMYYTSKGFKRLKKTAVPHIEATEQNKEKTLLFKQELPGVPKMDMFTSLQSSLLGKNTDADTTADAKSECKSFSGISSVLDTPETSQYKTKLRKCRERIETKNNQLRNLRKQTKRLLNSKAQMKAIIEELNDNRLQEESLYKPINYMKGEPNPEASKNRILSVNVEPHTLMSSASKNVQETEKIKINEENPSSPSLDEPFDITIKEEPTDDQSEMMVEPDIYHSEHDSESEASAPCRNKTRKVNNGDDDPKNPRDENEEVNNEDARKMFLLSLLPDVRLMTQSEMRVFRKTTIACIESIFDGRK